MQRLSCPERDDWRFTADKTGFDFHTIDSERYWDERAYYAFSLQEIERQIEQPTAEIEAMCLELVGAAMQRRLGAKPVWLSTAGAGVSWLHVRLDDRPKYYGYAPFREGA